MLTTLAALKTNLGISGNDYDTALTNALTMANAVIAGYIGCDLSDVATDKTYTTTLASPSDYCALPVWPVVSITGVTVDGNALDSGLYSVRPRVGQLDFLNGVTASESRYGCRVTVVYKAGFAAVPADLETVCLNMAATIYNNGGNFAGSMNAGRGELKSMTMFDAMSMSFETAAGADADSAGTPGGMLKTWAFILDNYRCVQPVMK